jgi:hypothetical protein
VLLEDKDRQEPRVSKGFKVFKDRLVAQAQLELREGKVPQEALELQALLALQVQQARLA